MGPVRELGKVLLLLGIILVAGGALLLVGAKPPLRLGHLPGDMDFRGRNTTFYFPLVTCLLLSAVLTLVFWLVSWFRE